MAAQPLRLLVLEDDPRIADRLGMDARFAVVHCATVAAAEASLEGDAPDCALARAGSVRDLRRIAPRLPVITLADADGDESLRDADLLARTVRHAIERKRDELELAHLALHDPITGLPNRELLGARIAQALARLPRSGRKLALLQLDLDGFKPADDSLGDDLLVQVADRLRPLMRPSDTVARLGPAGFAVLCDELRPGTEAEAMAGRTREALTEPFAIGGAEHHVAVSIGIAVAAAGASAERLLREASLAAAAAKRDDVWDHAAAATSRQLPLPIGHRPIRVVVCDDEPAIRALMRHALEHDGEVLIVGEAEDGAGVVTLVAEVQPDVVLLDLSMPNVDGLEALPRILEAAPGVSVLVLSGRDAAAAAPQALALGAERFLAKPARIEEIRAAVLASGARAPVKT
jgi:diguanylate cyclase (GGDEF)-like protein